MTTIKRLAAIAFLFVGPSFPALAAEQEPANTQERGAHGRYAPRPNDIMVATQLRHFKLWYAGALENWPLANYELAQIRADIELAKDFFPDSSASKMSMMSPPADEVESAIRAKDSGKFSKAFSKLTAACNSCHEATGFGFIKMRDPRLSPLETSPFSDESFSGK
jgi:hypothetical protein